MPRTAMASHRGLDYGQLGGSWREQATVIRNPGASAASHAVNAVVQSESESAYHADASDVASSFQKMGENPRQRPRTSVNV